MSRVPEIDPAAFSTEQHKLYDAMMASRPDGKLHSPSTMCPRVSFKDTWTSINLRQRDEPVAMKLIQ